MPYFIGYNSLEFSFVKEKDGVDTGSGITVSHYYY